MHLLSCVRIAVSFHHQHSGPGRSSESPGSSWSTIKCFWSLRLSHVASPNQSIQQFALSAWGGSLAFLRLLSGRDWTTTSCPSWVTGAMGGCTCPERWASSSCGGGWELGCPPKSAIQIPSFLCARDRPTEPWAGGCQGPLEGNASDVIPSLIASGLTQVLHTVGSVSYSIHRHSINMHS